MTDYQAMYDEAMTGWAHESHDLAKRAVQGWRLTVEPYDWGPNDSDPTPTGSLPTGPVDGQWTVGRLHFQVEDGDLTITTDDGEEVWTS